ncbi:Glutamate receptor ionotropic, delta-2 [Folsomia candida]|uniref:Glutamate receptor ionotropic, delta-2 n=1 Tax=Folsomia candida TaxID=158441 RepID=A0A226DPH6_FOLCA|nr:Glutamate receptor ionotropic, delta-2 [Folsomia candida]
MDREIHNYNIRHQIIDHHSHTHIHIETLLILSRTISPVYLPLVAKDVDPFVYVTLNPALLEPLLLSRALPARTKYKLGLSLDKTRGELVIRSVCFFCDAGGPVVLTLPAQSPATFDYFPDYVLNLEGHLLRIACPAIKSRIEALPPYEEVNNAQRGMWKTMFEQFLMVKFNFTYNVFLSVGKSGSYIGGGGTGLELENGTWIGTVGDIVAGRADIGIITANTPKRVKVVAFTNSFFDISYLNFITTEGTRVFSPAALLWSFDILMWACIGLSTVVAFLIFKIITRTMTALGLDKGDAMSFARRGIVSHENWGIQHQIFFVATSYLDQDCVLPRFTPLRCFVALWLFFTLIITTIYRSKMVSLLAFPVLEKLPLTFEQLVASDYQVGFIKHGDSAYNTLKASTDKVYVTLVDEMEIITGNGLECLERAVAKKYACIAYAFSTIYLKARNLSDSDIRKLVFAPESTYNIFMGLALEGGSIYKEGFERWLGWTRPFHLADLWEEQDMYYNVRLPKRAWWLETNQTDKLEHSDFVESDDLTLKHISGAFYALAGCLLICAGVFVQELVSYYWEREMEKGLIWVRLKVRLRTMVKLKNRRVVRFNNYY